MYPCQIPDTAISHMDSQWQLTWQIAWHTAIWSQRTMWCSFNTVSFFLNPHKIHPIARLLGRDMGCILWVSSCDLYSASITTVMYEICYIELRYKSTLLFQIWEQRVSAWSLDGKPYWIVITFIFVSTLQFNSKHIYCQSQYIDITHIIPNYVNTIPVTQLHLKVYEMGHLLIDVL